MHRSLLRTTYITGFLLTFHIALISYVNSSFLATKIPESLIGFLYTASAILAVIGLYVVPKLINRFGTSKILGLMLLMNMGSISAMIFSNTIAIVTTAFIIYFSFGTCIYLGLDILIEHWSVNSTQGSVRGIYLTAMSLAFMCAPLIGGFLMDRLGFNALYTLSAIMLVPVFIIVAFILPSITHTHASKGNILGLAKKFLRHPDFSAVFCINFILQFFYCWMVIYTPIYLHEHLGIHWDIIGRLFTIMLSAFVVSEYLIGKIADRFRIERGLMIIGLLIIATATMLVAKAPTMTFWILAATLFMTRIGASIVEVSTESYFFRRVNHDDTGSIGFFRNTYPFAYITAPLLSSVILKFAPLWTLYIVLGAICLLGILVAKDITKTR